MLCEKIEAITKYLIFVQNMIYKLTAKCLIMPPHYSTDVFSRGGAVSMHAFRRVRLAFFRTVTTSESEQSLRCHGACDAREKAGQFN